MTNSTAKISIIIPTYNTDPKLLKRCLDSIAEQTVAPYEILIINDGSDKKHTDEYKKLTKKYGAKMHTQKNAGLFMTRHIALEYVSGNFIIFVDSDDYISPNYIEAMSAVQKENNADVVLRSMVRVESGREHENSLSIKGQNSRDDIVTELLINNNIYSCVGSLIRLSCAKKAPLKPEINMGEDTLFIYSASKDAIIGNAPEARYYYVIHGGNMTNVGYTNEKIKKHLSDNIALYEHIRKDYPELSRVIDTALTSKAYDTLSFAMQAPNFRYKNYKELCKAIAQQINYNSDSVNIANFSRVKKIGIKLLARHHYYASYKLNQLKDFIKRSR